MSLLSGVFGRLGHERAEKVATTNSITNLGNVHSQCLSVFIICVYGVYSIYIIYIYIYLLLYYIILYYFILYYIILYYIILYYIMLYYVMLCYIINYIHTNMFQSRHLLGMQI